MPAQLVALNEGPSILVDKPILLLGRHPECDIQIDSRKISRRHCCIAQVNDYLIVRDLDSTNGIRINGVRVVEGKLMPGDELTIGNHRYQLTWDDAAARQAARPAVPAVPRKPNVAQAPAAVATPLNPALQGEDELLEACDEPVPLPDPGMPLPGLPRQPLPPSLPEDDESVLLPDNLQLMPNSGSYPGGSRPPGAK